MFNFDYITVADIKEHNPNQPDIPDHPYKILIVGESGLEKQMHLNLINYERDFVKILLFAKDGNKAKYQLLINKRQSTGLKYSHDSKPFIEYSNYMDNFNKINEKYNPNKKQKILIVFDNMIADMLNN